MNYMKCMEEIIVAEIKLIEEGFSSAKSNFDERREVISTEKIFMIMVQIHCTKAGKGRL